MGASERLLRLIHPARERVVPPLCLEKMAWRGTKDLPGYRVFKEYRVFKALLEHLSSWLEKMGQKVIPGYRDRRVRQARLAELDRLVPRDSLLDLKEILENLESRGLRVHKEFRELLVVLEQLDLLEQRYTLNLIRAQRENQDRPDL